MPATSTRIPAPLLIVGGMFSLQFGAALAQSSFDTVGPLGATLLRLIFAAAILVVLFRPKVWRWGWRAWRAAIFLGVALGAMNQFIYLSIATVPIGVAITIEFLGPLVLAMVQLRRFADAIWALLALVGVVLLGVQAVTELDPLGVAYAVAAGICWAGYILASANLGKALPGTGGLAVAMVVAAVVAVPLGASGALNVLLEPSLIALLLLVAVMSSAIPYALELRALRTLPTRVFGILQSVGPAAAAIAGFVVLGQGLQLREIAALIFVSVASIGISLSTRPRTSPSARVEIPG